MVEIVNVDLEAALAEHTQKLIGNFVADFGNNLKGGLDAEGVIQVHERAAKVAADRRFDVVGHYGATCIIIRPEPDKRDAPTRIGAYDAGHHAIEQAVNGLVDGPAGKEGAIPSAESYALQMFAYGGRQERAHGVIRFAADGFHNRPTDDGHGAVVTLEAQILHNLVKIKRQNAGVIFYSYDRQNVIEETS
jgi:hypothetical protein